MTRYRYYRLDDVPCRILEREEDVAIAQMYHAGAGFVPGPRMEIECEGVPLSKEEFDAMILRKRRK